MRNLLKRSSRIINKNICLCVTASLFLINSSAMADNSLIYTNSNLQDSNLSQRLLIKEALTRKNEKKYIPIDYTTIKISDYKLAVMHVLSEICPNLINQDRQQDFDRNFKLKVGDMLPHASDPKSVLNQLSTHKNYQKIFSSMKQETLSNFSDDENKALCEDFLNHKL